MTTLPATLARAVAMHEAGYDLVCDADAQAIIIILYDDEVIDVVDYEESVL